MLASNIFSAQHHPSVAGGGDGLAAVPKCPGLPRQAHDHPVQEVRARPPLQSERQPRLQLLRPKAHEHSPCQEEFQLEGRV